MNEYESIDYYFKKQHSIEGGEVVTIRIRDDGDEIIVINQDSESIGSFSIEDQLITRMHLEGVDRKYVHKGIGRASLQFYKEVIGNPLYVTPPDGLDREDGSELSPVGLQFAYKMIDEGLIAGFAGTGWNASDMLDDDYPEHSEER